MSWSCLASSPTRGLSGPRKSVLETLRLAPIVVLSLAAPILVRLRPSAWLRLIRLLARPRRALPTAPDQLQRRVERGLIIAGRLVPTTCLGRGLTRYVFLRRSGLPVSLAFGLGEVDGVHAGHCWIELRGDPYLEPVDPRPAFPEIFRIS